MVFSANVYSLTIILCYREWKLLEIYLDLEKCFYLRYLVCTHFWFKCMVFLKVIKSARVMKKAVAHLIPFMEEERALKVEGLKAQGLEITDEVRL